MTLQMLGYIYIFFHIWIMVMIIEKLWFHMVIWH